ncbi:hypothetical protein ACLOJK_020975 [Asimina triloba]
MAASLLSHSPRRFLSLMEPSTHLSVFCLLCLFLLFSLSVFLYRKKKKNPTKPISTHLSVFPFYISPPLKRPHQAPSKQLFVQILTSSHSPKWAAPDGASSDAADGSAENPPSANGSEPELDADAADDFGKGGRELKGKRKKKRGKKKRQNPRAEDDSGREEDEGQREKHAATVAKPTLECLYPFTSSSSVTQRKIKLHYDELVKSNEAKALTMAQVGQFANCLIEARNELQHKSEIIQRRFTITKALLFKADRSSFDRLCQQIYKLEAEQKRLEEDATVYNRLQEQLKLSPAYKKMLEIGSRMESQASSGKLVESPDAEFGDISFEELLAQEKKDSFW